MTPRGPQSLSFIARECREEADSLVRNKTLLAEPNDQTLVADTYDETLVSDLNNETLSDKDDKAPKGGKAGEKRPLAQSPTAAATRKSARPKKGQTSGRKR